MYKKKHHLIYRIFLSLAVVAALALIGSMKSGYHVDEIATFGLANHQYNGTTQVTITDGIAYTGQQLWQEYTTVDAAHSFDYSNVIENQIHDVHPPLYYILIHTICSFFPGTFSVWMGLAVNIGLAVIIFWQMVWLFRHFIHSLKLSILFSLLFLFTMGFVNSVVFFRMYVLLAVWTNALAMLFCRYKPQESDTKFYIWLSLIMIGGTMTQYYFLVFAFFSAAVYAIFIIKKKNWKKLILSIISIIISFVVSTCIFPEMWTHIFSSYRGEQSFSNLSQKNLPESVKNFFNIINLQVYGSLFPFLLILIVLLAVIGFKTFRRKGSQRTVCGRADIPPQGYLCLTQFVSYMQLLVPSICYILIIAKISPGDQDQYVMNIMGILYLLVFAVIIRLTYRFSNHAVIGIIAAVAVLICSYREGIPHLYIEEKNNVAVIESLGEDIPCLYIYNQAWRAMRNYQDMANLTNIVFLNYDNLNVLSQEPSQNYDRLLLYIVSTLDAEEVIHQLLEENPDLNTATQLFEYGYSTAYYLE